MPVSHIPSSEAKKASKSSYKRRKDQNSEISELEALLPWSQKGAGIDKISILRLTSTFMKFRDFWESIVEDNKGSKKPFPDIEKLFSEAIDGFLLILSSSGEVLYVSEAIADYVGVTQQEIIGLSIYELTHVDDHDCIRENLKAKGIKPRQFRQFYIRFKSSISPVKKQLSKFGGTIMLQVSGNLKISQRRSQYLVTGLVAECRRIESSSSILEVSIPQVMFTSTTTMDLKIISVDTKMATVTGFSEDIKGTILTDFFHPSDNRRSIHCLKLLLITGQANSPIIRFMTHTGEWVWVQIQGLLRYEKDNKTPKYLEANFKLICASGDNLTMIEQKELYGKVDENSENAGIHADSRFCIPDKPTVHGPEAIIQGFEDAKVSPAVRDVLLHGREEALMSIPMNMDRLACWGEVVEAVVEYEVSKGLTPNYEAPYPAPPSVKPYPLTSSPASSSLTPASYPSSINSSSPPPLSHPAETSPPYSSPEPTTNIGSVGSSMSGSSQATSSNLSSELSAAFDIYMPSNGMAPTFNNLTNQFRSPNTPPLSCTSSYSGGSSGAFSPGSNHAGSTPPVYSPPQPGYNSTGPIPSTSTLSHQNMYGGSGAGATNPGVMTGPSAMAMQYNEPNVVATQYNGPSAVATQYNNAGSIASQYNGPGVHANQYNGPNVSAMQYNGTNVMATQYNSHGAMATQYNTSSAQAQQFNGVNIITNQYMGQPQHVPTPQHCPQNGSIPFNAHPMQHVNGTNPSVPPVINMNVTINVPTPVMMPSNGMEQKTMGKLTHLDDHFNNSPELMGSAYVGKIEQGQNSKSFMPCNMQGTFEVSAHTSNGWPAANDMNNPDDILKTLQLI